MSIEKSNRIETFARKFLETVKSWLFRQREVDAGQAQERESLAAAIQEIEDTGEIVPDSPEHITRENALLIDARTLIRNPEMLSAVEALIPLPPVEAPQDPSNAEEVLNYRRAIVRRQIDELFFRDGSQYFLVAQRGGSRVRPRLNHFYYQLHHPTLEIGAPNYSRFTPLDQASAQTELDISAPRVKFFQHPQLAEALGIPTDQWLAIYTEVLRDVPNVDDSNPAWSNEKMDAFIEAIARRHDISLNEKTVDESGNPPYPATDITLSIITKKIRYLLESPQLWKEAQERYKKDVKSGPVGRDYSDHPLVKAYLATEIKYDDFNMPDHIAMLLNGVIITEEKGRINHAELEESLGEIFHCPEIQILADRIGVSKATIGQLIWQAAEGASSYTALAALAKEEFERSIHAMAGKEILHGKNIDPGPLFTKAVATQQVLAIYGIELKTLTVHLSDDGRMSLSVQRMPTEITSTE